MGRKITYGTKQCEYCGKDFEVITSNKRSRERATCSQSCAGKLGVKNSKPTTVECKICEKPFAIPIFKIQKEGNFCSDDCRKIKYTCNCQHCKTEFRSAKRDTIYCSIECVKLAQKEKLIRLECACCGISFERPSFTAPSNKRHFCSKGCAQKQFSRENPNRYGSRWSRIRIKILERDDYTCKKCSKRTFEKYALNVHHIIPIEQFDDIDDANVESNLEVLCYECHMEHHGKEILTDD